MKTEISKKAAKVIASFTARERSLHDYLIELYKNTIEKIEGCSKEIYTFKNDNPTQINGLKEGTKEEIRLQYIWQALQLNVSFDYETKTLTILSDIYADKDNKKQTA